MAFNGYKFFSNDKLALINGGSVGDTDVSELEKVFDGSRITLGLIENFIRTRYLESEEDFDVFYVWKTNASSIELSYYDNDASAWVDIEDGVNATIITSADGNYVYYKMDSTISTDKIRFQGALSTDYIYEIYGFEFLGELTVPVESNSIKTRKQDKFILENGKSFIYNRGSGFSFNLNIETFANQADITLIETIKNLDEDFYIWLNSGNESQFEYKFEPFRFQDLYKVAVTGNSNPRFPNNFYWRSMKDALKLEEVG